MVFTSTKWINFEILCTSTNGPIPPNFLDKAFGKIAKSSLQIGASST